MADNKEKPEVKVVQKVEDVVAKTVKCICSVVERHPSCPTHG